MENNHNPMEDDGSLDFLKIPYVLAKIREMDKFPRRVTMRASGTRYYLE